MIMDGPASYKQSKNTSRNLLRNIGFPLFQRQLAGTLTVRTDDSYGADGFVCLSQTAAINSARVAGTGTRWAYQLYQPQVAAQRMGTLQILEHEDTIEERSKTLTAQGELYQSVVAQDVRIALLSWDSTADVVTSDIVNNWTSTTYTASNFFIANLSVIAITEVSVSTNYVPFAITGEVGASANNLILAIWTEGTIVNNGSLQIQKLDLFRGGGPRLWREPDDRDITLETIRCQRYYEKSYNLNVAPNGVGDYDGSFYFNVGTPTSSPVGTSIPFKVRKRIVPTIESYDGAGNATRVTHLNVGGNQTRTIDLVADTGFRLYSNAASSQGLQFQWTADAEL